MLREDLDRRFQFHPADDAFRDDDPGPRHAAVRAACRWLAGVLDQLAPDSPELYVTINKLQEVSMWANAAIALGRRPDHVHPDQEWPPGVAHALALVDAVTDKAPQDDGPEPVPEPEGGTLPEHRYVPVQGPPPAREV